MSETNTNNPNTQPVSPEAEPVEQHVPSPGHLGDSSRLAINRPGGPDTMRIESISFTPEARQRGVEKGDTAFQGAVRLTTGEDTFVDIGRKTADGTFAAQVWTRDEQGGYSASEPYIMEPGRPMTVSAAGRVGTEVLPGDQSFFSINPDGQLGFYRPKDAPPLELRPLGGPKDFVSQGRAVPVGQTPQPGEFSAARHAATSETTVGITTKPALADVNSAAGQAAQREWGGPDETDKRPRRRRRHGERRELRYRTR